MTERVGLLDDVGAGVDSGNVDVATALAAIPLALKADNRHLVNTAQGIALQISGDLLSEPLHPRHLRCARAQARAHGGREGNRRRAALAAVAGEHGRGAGQGAHAAREELAMEGIDLCIAWRAKHKSSAERLIDAWAPGVAVKKAK